MFRSFRKPRIVLMQMCSSSQLNQTGRVWGAGSTGARPAPRDLRRRSHSAGRVQLRPGPSHSTRDHVDVSDSSRIDLSHQVEPPRVRESDE